MLRRNLCCGPSGFQLYREENERYPDSKIWAAGKKVKKRELECPADRMVTKQKIRCMSNQNISGRKILVQESWSSSEHRSQVTGTQGARKWNFKMKRRLEEHMVKKWWYCYVK